MLLIKRPPVLIAIIYFILFYAWLFIFRDQDFIRTLGTVVLLIIGESVGLVWLVHSFLTITGKQRYFWLFASIGVLLSLIAYAIWFYYQFILQIVPPFPSIADYLWLIAYFLFLVALLYYMKVTSKSISIIPFISSTLIFMTIATVVSIHYLIVPILSRAGASVGATFVTLAYPIINLGILLVVLNLLYLSQYSRQRKFYLIIAVGFLIEVITDSIYVYQSITGYYQAGVYFVPLWLVAVLLLGLAGLFAHQHTKEPTDHYPGTKRFNIFMTLPYISVLVLQILVFQSYSYSFNSLSVGISIVIIIIFIHQILVRVENNKLTWKYMHLAYHDILTGLKNRSKFQEDLEHAIDHAKNNQRNIFLMLIDIDRFKFVNDTLGHMIGDHLLKNFSQRLQDCIGDKGMLYRLGGDEFMIVLSGTTHANCIAIAEQIMKQSAEPFVIAKHEIIVTHSIGISIFPEDGDNLDELFKNADSAMYLAKERGKNNFQFYNTVLKEVNSRKTIIENGLRKAVVENQFTLHYQPKVDLHTREIVGMEALLRWDHSELGLISPLEFITIAEETGQIVSISEWVLKTACTQNKRWQDAGLPAVPVSVNVSIRQFQIGNIVSTVKKVLEESQLHPQYLELEITEGIVQNIQESTKILNELKTIGVEISLDDFGTGYYSLHMLKNLPIDTIKIDKTFIDDIMTDLPNQSMAKMIIEMGLNLNVKVVAEGIEHEQQIEILRGNLCRIGQGYVFSKPLHTADFEKMLAKDIQIYAVGE